MKLHYKDTNIPIYFITRVSPTHHTIKKKTKLFKQSKSHNNNAVFDTPQ